MSSIEFVDVFLKAERFAFICSECFATVMPGYHDLHANWHDNDKKEGDNE